MTTLLTFGLILVVAVGIWFGLAIMEARDEERLKDEQEKEAEELKDWK